ncbi:MAG: M28 family peptidase [Clostridia bacterium]|nr:M28 family peptidase [Clostridia bacterium]
MQGYNRVLSEQYPVRKTEEEKTAFLKFLTGTLEEHGYQPETEVSGLRKSRNIVVGNPEKAAIVLCAHYDTPAAKWPGNLLIPVNIPAYFVWQLLSMLLLLVPALVLYLIAWQFIGRTAVWLFFLSYVGLLLWQTIGSGNRNNRNQSSGLAVLLEVMAALPESARRHTAFVFFDRGEEFTLGAKAYGKEHLQVQYTRLILQLDALGLGKELVLIPKKPARKCTGYQRLVRILEGTEGMHLEVAGAGMQICPGDYKCFQCGMILLSCVRRPLIGLCIPNLHTRRDTEVDEKQLEAIGNTLIRAVSAMGEAPQNPVDEML